MSHFCHACGAEKRSNAAFCPQCGEGTNPPPVAPVRKAAPKPVPSKLALWAGLVLLVAVLAYFGMTRYGPWRHDGVLYDITRIADNPADKYVLFATHYEDGTKLGDIYSAAASHCLLLRDAQHSAAGCEIFIMARPAAIPAASPQEAERVYDKLWQGGEVVAIYILRSDSAPRDETGEIFLVDCAFFKEPAPQAPITCKGTNGDEPSLELNREAASLDQGPEAQPLASDGAIAAAAAEVASAAAYDAAASSVPAVEAGTGAYYVVADANRRSGATAASTLTGKIARGTMLKGAIVTGLDGQSSWLRLADSNGFVSAVNVSQSAPPTLVRIFGDRRFYPPGPLQLLASPSPQAAVVDTVPAGNVLVITGLTANGYAEAKGRAGALGILWRRVSISAPIGVSLTQPGKKCNLGGARSMTGTRAIFLHRPVLLPSARTSSFRRSAADALAPTARPIDFAVAP